MWSTWYSKIVEILFFIYRNINVQKKKSMKEKRKKNKIKTYVVYVQPIIIRFVTRLLWEAVLQMCSYEKVFWKTWSKLTGKHLCWNVVSIKWQLYWNHPSACVFSCKFVADFSEQILIRTPLDNCPCMVL